MKATAMAMSALGWVTCVLQAGVPDLATVLANDEAVSRLRELAPYVKSLGPEEVPTALKQAAAGHGPGRKEAIYALSGRWVELDAPAALAFSRQTSDREARDSIQSAYFAAWVERDADGALDAASRAEAGERARAIWEVAHHIGADDPQRAHELIKTIQTVNMLDSDHFLFWNWAERNLPQATQTLLKEAKVSGSFYPCQTEVWAITDRLLEDDPKAATKWVAQLPPGKVREEAIDRLASEWKRVDPESVAQWLKSLPDSEQTRNALLNLPKKTAESAPGRAKIDPTFARKADELNNLLEGSNFWSMLEALLPLVDGFTSAEFPQALELLRNTSSGNRDAVIDVLVARWSEVDPAGAIEAIPVAATIHDGEFSDRFLADIYAAWAQREPEAALAAATRDRPGLGNYDVLRVIFAAFARQDPVKAYAAFRKLHDANSHMLAIPIFTEWAAHDLPGATEALSKEPHPEGAIEGIVIGLMRKGPAAAITWAEQLSNKSHRNRARQDIALRWPDDPEAAAAWLEKIPDFEGKDAAFDDVAVAWAIRNSMEALRHAITLADGKEKDALLFWGLAQLTYDDAGAAQYFARQLSGDAIRKRGLTTVLEFWSEYHPAAAAAFLSSIKSEATPSDVAIIASSLSDGDPVSAVQWLDAFPASLDKTPAIGKIAENWYRSDSPTAGSWVNQLPAGPLYDAGARGICAALRENLTPALKWARSIRDPKIRRDAVFHAFEDAISYRLQYMDITGSHGIKDEIRGAPELTDADKNALIARIPSNVPVLPGN